MATADLAASLARLDGTLSKMAAAFEAERQDVDNISAGAQANSPTAALNALSPALGTLAVVASQAASGFQGLASAISPFVEAFDPSGVMMFQHAVRDVQAVIGSALSPVLRTMTEVVRALGDQLLPLVRKAQEPLARLSAALGVLAQVVVANAANAFSLVIDALAPLVPLAQGLGSALEGGLALLSGALSQVAADLGALFASWGWEAGNTESALENFRDAMQQATRQVILAAASLAKLAGMNAFLDGLISGLGGDRQKGAAFNFQAVQNAQVTSASNYNRSLATAAAMASMAPDQLSKEDQWRKDVVKELQNIKNGSNGTIEEVGKLIATSKEFFDKVGKVIDNPLGGVGQAVGRVGGLFRNPQQQRPANNNNRVE